MKAIILADGKNQMLPLGDGLKCLIKINGEVVLDKLIKNLRECGIKDVSVIVGYNYRQIKNQLVKRYLNHEWYYTNEVGSLYYASNELNDDVIILQGNIILEKQIIKQIIEKEGKIVVVRKNRKFFGITKLDKEICKEIINIKYKKMNLRKVIFSLARIKKKKIKIKMVDTDDKQEIFNLDDPIKILELKNLYRKRL